MCVQALSWIKQGVVLPGGCNLTREEQEVEAVCKEVIKIMVHESKLVKEESQGGEEQWGKKVGR